MHGAEILVPIVIADIGSYGVDLIQYAGIAREVAAIGVEGISQQIGDPGARVVQILRVAGHMEGHAISVYLTRK